MAQETTAPVPGQSPSAPPATKPAQGQPQPDQNQKDSGQTERK